MNAIYTPTVALPAEELVRRLNVVARLYHEWGEADVEDLDPLDMWERIGLALRGEVPA